MGHHKDNGELREDRYDQEQRRQDIRHEVAEETGAAADLGSQDERRKEGLGRL